MLENTEGAIKNRQFLETGSIEYTRRRKAEKTNIKQCVLGTNILKQTQTT